ncbi:MAG: hypothetical protein JWQ32_3621 [Marmoricola sp.]|nr:hypothetical protein [Marmoricola sp.]
MTKEDLARISIGGGYDFEPEWLGQRDEVIGSILMWIPGQNSTPACVVLLVDPLTATGDVRGERLTPTGQYLVLQLRYSGQVWERTGTVHVELCEVEPPDAAWPDREPGAWVESHATYTMLG